MASRLALATRGADFIDKRVGCSKKKNRQQSLTVFDHLTYHVTLCVRKSIGRRDFRFLLCSFVAVLF